MAIFLVLFVVALICLFVASRFDDPLGNGNKISMTFGYTGIVAGILSSILFMILIVVELVAAVVFFIGSQIAFTELAIRLIVILFIFLLLVYFTVRAN